MTGPRIGPQARERAARVRVFLTDVDGVLTDGGIVFDGNGLESKRFHVRDGHGIKLLQRGGLEVGIISGRSSDAVDVRARELGVRLVRQGAHDKTAVLREILSETAVSSAECAYVGDDIVDLPILRSVGFSAAPSDAEPYVLEAVDFVASRPGGMGAVREIIEFVLRATGAWERVTGKYFDGKGGR